MVVGTWWRSGYGLMGGEGQEREESIFISCNPSENNVLISNSLE